MSRSRLEEILEACRAREAEGYEILRNTMLYRFEKQRCPLGAVSETPYDWYSLDYCGGFAAAVDGHDKKEGDCAEDYYSGYADECLAAAALFGGDWPGSSGAG